MPGWHARTKELQDEGKLQLVGIIQEQHAERCRLFMQWHRMSWPVLVDSLNITGSKVVPRFLCLDEQGVVRAVLRGRRSDIRREFLDKTFPAAPDETPPALPAHGSAAALRHAGDRLFHWGGKTKLDEAIATWRGALQKDPRHGPTLFRLGVAHRRRFESAHGRPDDFQKAVDYWARALDVDPNQYIWRRRIQQFGPILDKPYPFYDWIARAQEEIAARGEKPHELSIALTRAELVNPRERESGPPPETMTNPDPGGRITRDQGLFVTVTTATIPTTGGTRGDIRLHVELRPRKDQPARWNNAAEPLRIWIEASPGVSVRQPLLVHANPRTATSSEPRHLEVDLNLLAGESPARSITIKGFALYNVCETAGGECLFRRQDFEITLNARK